MSLEHEVKLLRNIPLFANIDTSKLKLLAFTSEWLQFEAGEYLCHQGDMGDAAYLITQGEVEIIVDSPRGPVVVAIRSDSEVIGETAILCDVPRTASVRAKGSLATLKISKEVFLQMVTSYPQMAVEIIRILADRLEKVTFQLGEIKASIRTDADQPET